MSFRCTRIPSIETGPFNKQRNKATVVLPADAGIVDLDSTRLMLRTSVTCDMDVNGFTFTDVPYPVGFGYCAGSTIARSAHCLIKNVNSRSSELGVLLPARPYQNILTNCIEAYTRSRSGMREDTLFGRHVTKYYNKDVFSDIEGSIFFYPSRPTQVDVPQTNLSTWVTPELAIPMYCLDSRARGMRQFPCAVFGDTTYSVEFEDKLTLLSATNAVADQDVEAVNAIEVDGDWKIGVAGAELVLADVSSLDEIPFWVGQYVKIIYTPQPEEGQPPEQLTHDVRITSIVFTAAGECKLLISDPQVGNGLIVAQGEVTGISLAWIEPNEGSLAWSIEDINLEPIQAVLPPDVLQEVLSVPMGPNGMDLPYYDYEHYQFNVPQTNIYNCTINVGPGCVGLFSTFLSEDSLEGNWNGVGEYSYSINGTNTSDGYRILVGYEGNDLTNALNVQVNRQLHNTRLKQFFRNIGIPLRKYDTPFQGLIDKPNRYVPSNAIFPQIVPNVPVAQVVQLTLRAAAGNQIETNTLDIFVMYKRTEQIRSGNVEIING